jgi:hypothetical protein
MTSSREQLEYYTRHSPLSDPGEQAGLFAGLPSDLDPLCRVVQGSLVHIFWAERYGVTLSETGKETVGLRPVSAKLARLAQEDPAPLTAARPLERRQAGNCRDFSLLLASLLRHQGVPARPRCGFGTYFTPDHFEDHWVCEYWNASQGRWVLVDAQLDELQRRVLDIDFDPLDVPRNRFIVGGQAWQMCRRGQADPDCFGIMDMHGWWFIWGDLLRDFLSLNKVEILPWDWWESPYWSHRLEDPLPADERELAPYDELAALTLAGDEAFPALRLRYESDPGFKPPFPEVQAVSV